MTLLLLACANTDPVDLSAGDYQFATVDMTDSCLDGALEALFMPSGRSVPQEFEFPVYVPGRAELPTSYEISLREPFVGMPVDVTSGGTGVLNMTGQMDEVALNTALYGDCVATMAVSAELVADTKKTGSMVADVDITDARSAEDERCPPLDADPCRVTLFIEGEAL